MNKCWPAMCRRLPTFCVLTTGGCWALAAAGTFIMGGGGGRDSSRSTLLFSLHAWLLPPGRSPVLPSWLKPFERTGVSVANAAAVTERVCNVPVRAGEDPWAGCWLMQNNSVYEDKAGTVWNWRRNQENLPRPTTDVTCPVELPAVGCAPRGSSCGPPAASCVDAGAGLRPTYPVRRPRRPSVHAELASFHPATKTVTATWKVTVETAIARIPPATWRSLPPIP